jgi:hypothetical protein
VHRFAHLRNEIDWGLRYDPSACVDYAALDLGRRGFVPVSKLTERTCPNRFGGAWAALSQVCVAAHGKHRCVSSVSIPYAPVVLMCLPERRILAV